MVRDSEKMNLNGLASDLVNLYNENLGSNMESDTEVNVSIFFNNTSYKINLNQKFFVANQFLFSLAMIANQIFQSISSPEYGVGPCSEFTILSFTVNKHKSVSKGYLIIYVPAIDIIFTIIPHTSVGTFYTLDWRSLLTLLTL